MATLKNYLPSFFIRKCVGLILFFSAQCCDIDKGIACACLFTGARLRKNHSECSSCLRIDNAIKDSLIFLDKEIYDILNFDSKDLASHSTTMGGKTSRKVCKAKLNDNKSKTSRDFTSSHVIFDYLEECSIVSLESEQGRNEFHNLDVDYYFRYKLLIDELEIHDI